MWSNEIKKDDKVNLYPKPKIIKEKEKINKKLTHFIPNNQYDYSADTDEFTGMGEITNKISTINIKHNNINHIDTSTAELVREKEEDYVYSKSFVHTPQKFNRQNTMSSNNSLRINTPYPGMHIFKGSMVSQTTHGSSSNKKVYIDSDMEGIDIEEHNADRLNMQHGRIPTCESIESNNNIYNETKRFFSSSFTDRNYYFMQNNMFDNAFCINSNQKKNKNKKHTNSDIPKGNLGNIINLDNV